MRSAGAGPDLTPGECVAVAQREDLESVPLVAVADPNAVIANRNDTTVAPQALFLLNHPFVREQSRFFTGQLLNLAGSDNERIASGYRLALGRDPSDEESNQVRAFLSAYEKRELSSGESPDSARRAAWQCFCQTLYCRNEFLYVD